MIDTVIRGCADYLQPEAVSSFRVVSRTPANKVGGLGILSIPVRFALNGETLSQTKEEGS
jgi:hypothetical protein